MKTEEGGREGGAIEKREEEEGERDAG